MELYIILPFMVTYYTTCNSQSADFNVQYKLVERFLTVRNLDCAVLFTCWSITDRVRSMQILNEKRIAIAHRNMEDFVENYRLDNLIILSLYSPSIGLVVDWSCNEDVSFKFSESSLWNSSYHWLMMMKNKSNKNIQSFLTSKNINLTVNSEVLLAYPYEMDDIFTNWHIFDVYRTAFEPDGQLMFEVLNETFGKWGNRLWKFDKRSNLQNLTLNVVCIDPPHGKLAKKNGTDIKSYGKELVKYLTTFNLERFDSALKYSYALMYSATKAVLNITMNIKTTHSWGYKINDKWDGIVGILLAREAEFSITINGLKPERVPVVDHVAITTWRHNPCFIYRRPRLSSTSTNIFLQPFEMTVWICLIGIMLLFSLIYYTIIYFESNKISILNILSNTFLLKIGALCQQGTTLEPTKLSNRFIVLLVFVFSLTVFQFYSSSIVSGLLRPAILTIDTVKKLEESGLDVGVEDVNYVGRIAEVQAEMNPYMKRIYKNKIKSKSEYVLLREGLKKMKKGYYVLLTDPAVSYWLIKDIFTEKEKCDLAELHLNRPEVTGFLIQKNSPYKKLINYASNIVMETGLMDRENQIWHAEIPECVAGKTITEDDLVSVEIKDIASLLAFMLISFMVSFIILILEIIVYRYNVKK